MSISSIRFHAEAHGPAGPVAGDIRQPLREWLLCVVTLGVYAVVQHHRVNRELRDFGIDVEPTRALLAFFPGMVLVVPMLVTVYRTTGRLRVAEETVGLTPSADPLRAALASLLLFAHVPYEQAHCNEMWRADARTR